MPIRARFVVAVLWIASLLGVAALVNAQQPWMMVPLAQPVVLSGSDVGFRLEGQVGNRPAGRLVIRVAGEWVVPTTPEGPARLASR
jgi:hypothetical protein